MNENIEKKNLADRCGCVVAYFEGELKSLRERRAAQERVLADTDTALAVMNSARERVLSLMGLQ